MWWTLDKPTARLRFQLRRPDDGSRSAGQHGTLWMQLADPRGGVLDEIPVGCAYARLGPRHEVAELYVDCPCCPPAWFGPFHPARDPHRKAVV